MKLVVKKKGSLAKPPKARAQAELSLPTELSVPSDNMLDYITLMYGEKKIGKTSLWSHADRAFFMMCESGAKALKLMQRPVNTWEQFKSYVALLEKDTAFRTVVVDTVDLAYLYCTRAVCKKMGIEHPSDEDWGKGWSAVREEFITQINRLTNSGKGVVLISHAAEREIKTRTGDKYDKIIPTVPGQAREVLEGIVDIWAYYSYSQQHRMLVIQGDDHIGAGHRLDQHFRYASGKRIREIPMGNSSKEAYDNFVAAFRNQLKEVGHAPVRGK